MSEYQIHVEHLQSLFTKALAYAKYDQVLIYSGEHSYGFLDDNAFGFKTNPYFKYWLPLPQQQKSFVCIEAGKKPKVYLFQQEDYWHAQPKLPEGEWLEYFDLEIIDDPEKVIRKHLINKSNAAAIGDFSLRQFKGEHTAVNPSRLLNYLDYHRAYKTEWEKSNLRRANILAAKGHLAAKQAFYQGKTEFETHLAYLQAISTRETQLPYNNIIAFGQNASVLHYDQYQTQIVDHQNCFLIDAGASVNGYNADISRTYVKDAELDGNSETFSAMFAAYTQCFKSLLSEIELGKSFLEFHDSAHKKMTEILCQFDVLNCSVEKAYDKGYSQRFFPCGVGHYIGAQVHDVGGYLANEQGDSLNKDPRYPFLRLMRPMEQNIAFTVEPGIYFIDSILKHEQQNTDFNWKVIESLKPFGGFRLEDTIIMNASGAENISAEWVPY